MEIGIIKILTVRYKNKKLPRCGKYEEFKNHQLLISSK